MPGGEVRAIGNGRVVYVQEKLAGWGHMMRIEHELPNGQLIYSQYAHLLEGSLQFTCGNSVSLGQMIGSVGNTGTSDAAHLHLEVKVVDENGCGYLGDPDCPNDSFNNYLPPLAFIDMPSLGVFDFAVSFIAVDGNIPNVSPTAFDFFDGFNDGSLTAFPTSEFFCFDTVKSETGGFLNLRSSDGFNTFTPPFRVDNCQLGVATETTLIRDGNGDATITASFRADPPIPGQAYGLQLPTLFGEENVNIQLGASGAGTVVVGFVVQTGFVQTVPVDLTGVERILLRLEFQDSTNRVFPSFSINNGITFTPIALPPTATVFTPSGQNRAFVSLFGSVIAD